MSQDSKYVIREQDIRNRLYEKYIEPTQKEREKYIGIEIELPIVNLEKKAVDFAWIHEVTEYFVQEFSFEVTGRDTDGYIYAAQDQETGDIVSYDCSYNNLEFSFGKGKDLHTLNQRFRKYFTWFQEQFGKKNHMLTGMGINPYRKFNQNVPIANERYRMLFHHLDSVEKYRDLPMYFHPYTTYGSFSSASQVQLDVEKENLIQTIRAFSKLEPVKALLFSNSILLDDREELLCCRDMMWENSTHGINPHNIGMFDQIPESIEELCAYIESTSLYCVEREGKYINFEPTPVMDYFKQPFIEGEYFDQGVYKTIKIIPELDDLQYLRTFKFEDLTFRGTIEFRSVCCQPVSEAMSVAAFHIGLMSRLEELDQLLEEDEVLYHHGYNASELRKQLVQRSLAGFIEKDSLYELAYRIVKLSEEGLKERGLGEEIYLEALYERIKNRENPAEKILEAKESGIPIEEMIRDYGTL